MEQKKKTKIIIIVLAVLLGVSLLALGGTLIRSKIPSNTQSTVIVPDNLITPDEEINKSDSIEFDGKASDSSNAKKSDGLKLQLLSSSTDTSLIAVNLAQNTTSEKKNAETIELYNKHPEDNTTFNVGNMFPGDSETKYFRVQVSYSGTVTVHYKATVRKGYEKLAEALKVKVKLLTTGETMYDGLMRDMPESLTHKTASEKSTTDELEYEITAYLDTSVGNEYQNKDLIADFCWWIEETDSLEPSPKTGDSSNMLLWVLLAGISGSAMIFWLVARKCRKEAETND